MQISLLVVCIFVPGKKQLIVHRAVAQGTAALRRAKASDTPAPKSNLEAPRKLRRDLISAIFSDAMGMTFLFGRFSFLFAEGQGGTRHGATLRFVISA
jgi:hypothetical protein